MREPQSMIARGLQIMFAKRTVARLQPAFAIDLDACSAGAYEAAIPALQDVERLLAKVPADAQGMRWIHRSEEVLFHGERTFDLPYENFIAKIDICHVGQFYRDALGVTTKVVDRDERGRTIRQGVRVIALPQPNYAAFLGKQDLDVYKLEIVEYSDDEQRVWIRTVHSPNGSAVCDDGYMSFSRAPLGNGTVVAFLACQNFPTPPLMRLLHLDRWGWFRTRITEDAYRRFCNVMMRNIDDCYHGRGFHVGRPDGQLAEA